MRIFLLLITFFILPCNKAIAKPKILVSISPIASLVAMSVGDKFDVEIVAKQAGCPHDFHLKPSELELTKSADLFVYINDDFEPFVKPLLKNFNGTKVDLSTNNDIKIRNNNWHIWLLPKNAKLIIDQVSKAAGDIMPNEQNYFAKQKSTAFDIIDKLEEQRQNIFDKKRFILLGDSVDYLCNGTTAICYNFSNRNGISINTISKIKHLLLLNHHCIVTDTAINNPRLLSQRDLSVQINSENWTLSGPLNDLYAKEYSDMLESIYQCSLIKNSKH